MSTITAPPPPPESASGWGGIISVSEAVENCPRCGESHGELDHRPFTRPNKFYHLWATCPTTGEPILTRQERQADGGQWEPVPPEEAMQRLNDAVASAIKEQGICGGHC